MNYYFTCILFMMGSHLFRLHILFTYKCKIFMRSHAYEFPEAAREVKGHRKNIYVKSE